MGRRKKQEAEKLSEKDKELLEIARYQTDGKNYNKHGVKSLDELLNERSTPYKHRTTEEYQAYLEELNLHELQIHAAEVQEIPRDDRFQLITNLIRKFELTTSPYFNVVEKQPVKLKPDIKVLKILGEGR